LFVVLSVEKREAAVTNSKMVLAAVAALAIGFGAFAQEDQTTGKILKIDQAKGTITLEHRQGGTTGVTNPNMLTDEYKIGQGLPVGSFRPGDQVSYTEARVDGVWTVTKMKKQ
jgi:Cu/Ag efflux protein CusF